MSEIDELTQEVKKLSSSKDSEQSAKSDAIVEKIRLESDKQIEKLRAEKKGLKQAIIAKLHPLKKDLLQEKVSIQ